MKLRDWVDVLNAPATTKDDHGNTISDWNAAVGKREPAEVSEIATSEYSIGQDDVVTRYRVLLHPGTTATDHSRLRWRTNLYEVLGEVVPVPGDRGKIDHCSALIERVS